MSTEPPELVLSLKSELVDTIESIDVFDITDSDYRSQLLYLIKLTIDSAANVHTKRAYGRYLRRFYRLRLPLSRLGILEYLARPDIKDKVTAKNVALAGFRRLVDNAASCQFLSPIEVSAIRSIKGAKSNPKLGRWLSIDSVRALISLPNRNTIQGARDGAILALVLGCGLRRSEAADILWDSYREINGRMCLVDLMGKGHKTRTVPVPDWAVERLDRWLDKLVDVIGFREVAMDGTILRTMWGSVITRKMLKRPLTSAGLAAIIHRYSLGLNIGFTPHDLRRTLAQLMRRAGVPIEQIQYTLGHDAIITTERYLGGAVELGAGKAGVDQIAW